MYYVKGNNRYGKKFRLFMDAFKHQQDKFQNKKILFSYKMGSGAPFTQVVWDPSWEWVDCSKL